MSKNMTRKGLAVGAGLALIATTFVSLPASATGIDNGSVSLRPTTGTNYAVLLGQSFSLRSNSATPVTGTGKFLKFRVVDANSNVTTTSGMYSVANTQTNLAFTAASAPTPATSTITFGAPHSFKIGDVVQVAGVSSAVNGTRTVVAVPSTTTIQITTTATAEVTDETVGTVRVAAHTNRAATGTYVVDTKVDTNTADKNLVLTTVSETSTSVDVTAWIDDNDNGVIDTTESRSPVRTVRFVAITDLTPTVNLAPVTTGDTALTVTMTTSPALNGQQVGNSRIGATFTRQDSAREIADFATWNVDTEVWESSVSLATGDLAASSRLFGTSTRGNWGFTNPDARAGVNAATNDATDPVQDVAVSTAGVVTITTHADHNLRSGDRVIVTVDASDSGIAIAAEAVARTVTVTGPKTFTYSVSETVLPTAALADTSLEGGTGYTVETYSNNNGLVTRAFPGTHTARFAAMNLTNIVANQSSAEFLSRVGTAVTSSSVARTAASLAVDVVESSTAAKVGADASDILRTTKSASVTVTVLRSTGAPAAGVAVRGLAHTITGGGDFTLNGAVAVAGTAAFVTTNANGQATFTVGNSLGNLNDAVRLDFSTEGLTAVTETLTWRNPAFGIIDLKDQSPRYEAIRDRFAATGGSYAFDLLVADQFRNPAPADFGILATITGRTVATSYLTLNAGKATLTVTDGGVGAGAFANVDLALVKRVNNVWTVPADAEVVDWSGDYAAGAVTLFDDNSTGSTADDEQRDVRVNFSTQTDRISLNANGASTPNTTTAAALSAAVVTTALTEADLRLVGGAAPVYASGTKATVSGVVANSATGVVNPGAVVTIAGTGMLFNAGQVWKRDSISIVASSTGQFAVDVYSTVSGSRTVSITSGNATAATGTIAYTAAGGATATGITVNLVAPASAAPGTTFQVQGQVRDVNGNPVVISTAGTGANPTLTVSYNGPGLINGALPTTTNAAGTFNFFVLLGSNDRGNATVTVSYDADGTGTTATAVTSTATVTVTPVEPVAKIGSFNGRVAVRVENAKGSTISVKIGRTWYKYSALNDNYLQSWRSAKGRSVAVSVYVDGELQNVQTITVR